MHTGRPIIRSTKTHVLVLCPFGHLVHSMLKREWGGSWLEARCAFAELDNWTVDCHGTMPGERA